MSRVDLLAGYRESWSVKFMEFTRIISKRNGSVAIFFEGEDEKYYSVRINTIRPDLNWIGINCGGKKIVLELRNKIRGHHTYKNSPCMFFVDSDFDNNNEIQELEDAYVTPCYSIENLYITDTALSRVLRAEFGLSDSCESSTCYHNAFSIFKKSRTEYLESISDFNYLIRELRIMENRGELNAKLNINNINFDTLIQVELDSSRKVYDESNPITFFPNLPKNLTIDTTNSKIHFSNLNPELWYRGKQHLEFFRIIVSQLKNDRCRKTKRRIFKEKGNVKLQLTKANCISELSQYADTPSCLKYFLNNRKVLKPLRAA